MPVPRSLTEVTYYRWRNGYGGLLKGDQVILKNNLRNNVTLDLLGCEGHVITAIIKFLVDPQKVMAELCPDDVAPAVAKAAIGQTRLLEEALQAEGTPDRYELIHSLIARVRIDASICVELRQASLIRSLRLPIDTISRDVDAPLQLTMPAELRRLGKEKRLIVAAHAPKTNPDAVLIKAIVQGHQ